MTALHRKGNFSTFFLIAILAAIKTDICKVFYQEADSHKDDSIFGIILKRNFTIIVCFPRFVISSVNCPKRFSIRGSLSFRFSTSQY
jgi:hypothetical protein